MDSSSRSCVYFGYGHGKRMTEQKTDVEQKEKQPSKQERIKAKIGAWWKSTVTEKITPAEPAAPEKAEPSTQSSSEKTTVSSKGRQQRSRRPSSARAKKSTDQKDAFKGWVETVDDTSVDEDSPSQEGVNADADSVETTVKSDEKTVKPKRAPRRRGRRKKEDNTGTKTDPGAEQKLPEESEEERQENQPVPEGAEQQDAASQTGEIADVDQQKTEQGARQKRISAPEAKEEAPQEPKPVTKLLINAEEPEECRLAILENGQLESIHVATSTRVQTKNNIYKARIVAVEPNLQAAFVDYGTEKNGFLPFSEIHPEYYKENVSDKVQSLIDQHQWKKLSITDVMERGREVLVQVVKEEVGKKGANMTTYLSLPGRCVVLMPGSDSKGISRKISGEERRAKLRDHLLSLKIPEGIGWIVRTASNDITKAALGRDVNYLLRLWDEVKKKGQELEGVGLIYQDHDHVLRFLREYFSPDLQEILVDDKDAFEQVKGFIEMLPAKQRKVKCKLHRGARPIFNQYSVEDQIESIYQPKVNLPSGGSIVIDPTEALVAIDVNSGSTSKGQNFEASIFQANIEAARELARQLRLRDLGGLIVVDFIDMRSKKNIREVEREVKTAMKRDKAKVDISRISKFGLMQISRQKLGAPIEAGNYRVCNHCKGRGIVRSVETLALYYLRRIHTAASRKMVWQVECRFPIDVAGYLLNKKRNELSELESRYNTEVVIIADPSYNPADNEIVFHKTEKDEAEKKQP